MIDPKIQLLTRQKEQVQHIIVIEKETGGLVALESMNQFDSSVHQLQKASPIETKLEKKEIVTEPEKVDAEKEIKVESKQSNNESVIVKTGKERYEELKKSTAWKKADLKNEYYALKAIHG